LTDIERESIRFKCENSFLFFFRYFFKKRNGYKAVINSHHERIAEHLERVYNGEITRLIINMPPRYGKTEIAVIAFVAWCIAKSPRAKFIHLTYSEPLALENSMKAKDIIQSDEFKEIWGLDTRKDAKSVKKWYTEHGGGVYATSSGAAVTGFGAGTTDDEADFGGAIVIDDPIKPTDANSDLVRKKINERIPNTIKSRVNSRHTPIIVIMQRVHEDDLTGYLLAEDSDDWTHLKISALDDNDNPLWEWKHTFDELMLIKSSSSYVFAGQYMQEPAPAGGGIIKTEWWRYYKDLPIAFDRIIQTADTAQKTKEMNDYTVIQTWGKFENKVFLIDQVRGKWEAPELRRVVIAQYNKHKPSSVLIEDKSSGSSLIQELRRTESIPIKAIQVNTDKVSRAHEVVSFIESGYVYLPQDSDWLSDFILECSRFPNGKHDDQVDPLTMGLKEMFVMGKNLAIMDYYANLAKK